MKIWKQISNYGAEYSLSAIDKRDTILTNRLNFALLVVYCIVIFIVRLEGMSKGNPPGIGFYRLLSLIFISILNLYLTHKNKIMVSKFNLLFISPLIFILLPTFYHYIEEESFIYYQYVLVGYSLVIQLIVSPSKNRNLYLFGLLFYFILIYFIDILLVKFAKDDFQIIPILHMGYIYYKIMPLIIFLFLHMGIFYLRSMSEEYYNESIEKNNLLDQQNEELNMAIAQQNKMQQQLVQAEKMAALGSLTSGIAHEINNPLNYIAGGVFFIDEIQEALNGEAIVNKTKISKRLGKSRDMIMSGINKATQIVNKLAIISEISNQERSDEDINALFDAIIRMENIEIDKGITVKRDYQLEQMVPVYKESFLHVLHQLIENAREAIEMSSNAEARQILISTLELDNKAVIVIKNTGNLIPDESVNKVFDPFYTTKSEMSGIGLGLTMAYAIIKEHNGLIDIVNSDNNVKVTLELPLSV